MGRRAALSLRSPLCRRTHLGVTVLGGCGVHANSPPHTRQQYHGLRDDFPDLRAAPERRRESPTRAGYGHATRRAGRALRAGLPSAWTPRAPLGVGPREQCAPRRRVDRGGFSPAAQRRLREYPVLRFRAEMRSGVKRPFKVTAGGDKNGFQHKRTRYRQDLRRGTVFKNNFLKGPRGRFNTHFVHPRPF